MSRELPTPDSFAGKRVLLRCEHSAAGVIRLIRYASPLHEIAAEVIVDAQPSLVPLLASARGVDRFGDSDYDVDLDIADLEHIFASLPAEMPYLHADPLELPQDHRFRVGVAWRASESTAIPFALIRRLAAVTGLTLYALQSELESAEKSGPFVVLSERENLLGSARLMRALDLVITVDSVQAQLAGALGVPVWTLAAENAELAVAEAVRDLRALTRRPHIRIDVDDHSTYLPPLTHSL